VRLSASVSRAVARGAPVVALESSVLAQGLPRPANAQAAARMQAAVRATGATPAITALVRGVPTVGLSGRTLERFLRGDGIGKVSARDLAPGMTRKADGATTVASALVMARLAGIDVFATGGIGGVHRGGEYDESADLIELSRICLIVVCAGAKAILDVPATAERLETLGVTVVGYRTDTMPAFYTEATDAPVGIRVESPGEIADVFHQHGRLGRPGSLLVVQPPPAESALRRKTVEKAVARGMRAAERARVSGPGVTPYLLAAVSRATGGRSVAANLALLEQNARLAGEVAVAVATLRNNR
jgi:pseudouridylate synthase